MDSSAERGHRAEGNGYRREMVMGGRTRCWPYAGERYYLAVQFGASNPMRHRGPNSIENGALLIHLAPAIRLRRIRPLKIFY
jgi:hypothetical protein